jgi:hypothetical protein
VNTTKGRRAKRHSGVIDVAESLQIPLVVFATIAAGIAGFRDLLVAGAAIYAALGFLVAICFAATVLALAQLVRNSEGILRRLEGDPKPFTKNDLTSVTLGILQTAVKNGFKVTALPEGQGFIATKQGWGEIVLSSNYEIEQFGQDLGWI